MQLRPIVNDTGSSLYCGPGVVCLITGEPASRVLPLFQNWNRVEDISSRGQLGQRRRKVSGVTEPVIRCVLGDLGYASELAFVAGTGSAMTVRQWLACSKRRSSSSYVIVVPGHVLAVSGRQGGDNHTMKPVPLSKAPGLDELVVGVLEVRPQSLAPTPLSAGQLKRCRKDMGLSSATLAEMLLLGTGGGRTIRRWESGESSIPGPAQVAVRLLWQEHRGRAREPGGAT